MKVYYYHYWTGNVKGRGKVKYIAEIADNGFLIRCDDVDRTFNFRNLYSPDRVLFSSLYKLSKTQEDKLLRHINHLKRKWK